MIQRYELSLVLLTDFVRNNLDRLLMFTLSFATYPKNKNIKLHLGLLILHLDILSGTFNVVAQLNYCWKSIYCRSYFLHRDFSQELNRQEKSTLISNANHSLVFY